MKYIRMLLAVVGLFVAGGAIGTALADDDSHPRVTLYTPPLAGANIACDAINVTDRTLDITITIIGSDGFPLTTTDPTNFTALPGTQVTSAHHEGGDSTTSVDGYCKFEVFGTRNRDDVRVDLTATVKRNIPGTTTPVWVFREVEGH